MRVAVALVVLANLAFVRGKVKAQSARIAGVTWVQSIDLRPLRRDSVLAATTTSSGQLRRTANGLLVQCPEGSRYCYFFASGARQSTRPLLQDLSIAAWGLGRGVSLHAHARLREALGASSAAWPRVNDRFDLIDGYLEVDREKARARIGRQWSLGGLGAYSYDGGSLTIRHKWLDGDAFGGRALVQGLNEPYSSAELGVVDDIPPETSAWLFGGRVRARAAGKASATASYLRVLQRDRSGLYSERASFDGSALVEGFRLNATATVDLAARNLNDGRFRVGRTILPNVDVALDARRHRPFFELWTIWGAFAPVAFDEGRATVSWRSHGGASGLSASAAYRVYGDANTGLTTTPLRNEGWRASVQGDASVGTAWEAIGSYAVDIGFGSSKSDGTLGLNWRPSDRVSLGATGSALQTIYEFRVGTGRILGLSTNVSYRMGQNLQVRADGGVYRHRLTNDAVGQNWSQRRASVRLEWAVGADPGNR